VARIDKFIEALVKRGADRVVLQSGEKVSLVFGGNLRPVTASVLHNKTIRGFVDEIAPGDLANEIGQQGEHRFGYDAATRPVWVEVCQRPDAIRVVLSPKVEDATETREPALAPEPPREAPAARVPAPAPASPPLEAPAAPEPAAAAPAPAAPPEAVAAPAPAGVAEATKADGSSVVSGAQTAEMDALFRQMCEEGC